MKVPKAISMLTAGCIFVTESSLKYVRALFVTILKRAYNNITE